MGVFQDGLIKGLGDSQKPKENLAESYLLIAIELSGMSKIKSIAAEEEASYDKACRLYEAIFFLRSKSKEAIKSAYDLYPDNPKHVHLLAEIFHSCGAAYNKLAILNINKAEQVELVDEKMILYKRALENTQKCVLEIKEAYRINTKEEYLDDLGGIYTQRAVVYNYLDNIMRERAQSAPFSEKLDLYKIAEGFSEHAIEEAKKVLAIAPEIEKNIERLVSLYGHHNFIYSELSIITAEKIEQSDEIDNKISLYKDKTTLDLFRN